MLKLNNISIRNKLVFMQVFTSVLVLIICGAAFMITDINSYKQRKAESMVSLAQVIAANSISTLQFQDDEVAGEILSTVGSVTQELAAAYIIDKNGSLFAAYFRSATDTFYVPPALTGKKFLYTGKELFVDNIIVNDKEVVGKVVLRVKLTELDEIIRDKYQIAFLLSLAAVGLSFLIGFVVQAYISKRLFRLVNTMKEVSKTGNYSKAIIDNGKDEISLLIQVFNNLMLEVRENQARKDEFIGIASHELKTPLTSIKGYAQLLNEIEQKEPNKQLVQKTLANVEKLEQLVKDLLDVSKIQTGQLQLNMKEFDMIALLNETISAAQMTMKKHQVVKEYDHHPQIVFADRQRIEQVLVNLLSNAAKYSPKAEKIIVSFQIANSEIIIKIRDFGIGIPKEDHTNIFERFYRTKNMPSTISGFGLGLYICRDIISRHNGKIWVETQDSGSAFYFSIPLTPRYIASTVHKELMQQ